MELLAGTTVQRRISVQALRIPDAIEVARQVAEALEHAHARGITHRDLKPENLMLLKSPGIHVKVLDFGLARVVTEATVTRSGAVVGTALYMSPEQVRGLHGVDSRSDIWSLGVILHELLSGQCPFRAESVVGTLFKILDEAPGALSPALPTALNVLVGRMLDKDPDRRPSAAEVRAALEQAPAPTLSRLPESLGTAEDPTLGDSDDGLAPTYVDLSLLADDKTRTVFISVVFLQGVRDVRPVTVFAEKLGGRATALLRDNHLVIFGHLRWQGDEPERAVRLAAAVAACADSVGVATGRVLRRDEHLVGMVAHNASSLANSPGVTADATTVALLRDRFAWTVRLDGSARLDQAPRPAEHASPKPGTPFVGRDSERNQLVDLARDAFEARAVNGVLVTGPTGMGKSRLRHEALRALRDALPDAVALRVRCDPLRAHTPFAALRESLVGHVDPLLAAELAARDRGLWRPAAHPRRHPRRPRRRPPRALGAGPCRARDRRRPLARRRLCDLPPVARTERPGSPALALALRHARRERTASGDPPERQRATAWSVARHPRPEGAPAHRLRRPAEILERAGGHPLFLEELGRLHAETGAMPVQLPPTLAVALHAALDRLRSPSRNTSSVQPSSAARPGPRASLTSAAIRARSLPSCTRVC